MQAIRTLLEGALDYAGLFPPAKLDMPQTAANYAAYRKGSDAWLLGRLVVPVSRFAELERAADALFPRVGEPGHDDAWPISAITVAAGDPAFAGDIAAIVAFNERHSKVGAPSAVVDCIETKASSADEIDAGIDLVPDEVFPYFELPVDRDPRGLIASLAGLDVAAKIRTGGVTADAHPSAAQVAEFVVACALAQVPFKATAGLHHPHRCHVADVGCRQHGFLNVFLGACFAWHEKLGAEELTRLLIDESPASMVYRDDGAEWIPGGQRVTLAEIRATRDDFAHSFGSCSFDEPLHDLRNLGLLTSEAAAR